MLSNLYIVSSGFMSMILFITLMVISFKIISSEQSALLKISQLSLSWFAIVFSVNLIYLIMTFLPQDEYCIGSVVQCMGFHMFSQMVGNRHIYGEGVLIGFIGQFISFYSLVKLSREKI